LTFISFLDGCFALLVAGFILEAIFSLLVEDQVVVFDEDFIGKDL
jgi:hypothetical protein